MMTDPIADLLTRIRNGVQVERPFVDVPSSKIKVSIVEALQREGFVWDYEVLDAECGKTLRVNLKYGPAGEHVIQHIERVSKPGCRVYCAVSEMKDIRQGTGIAVLSTSTSCRLTPSTETRKEEKADAQITCTSVLPARGACMKSWPLCLPLIWIASGTGSRPSLSGEM